MQTSETRSHRVCPQCGVVFRSGFQRCPNDGESLTPMTRDLMVGKTLDRYEIEAFLGEGMTGRVYRARHVDLSRRYAIKVLYGDFSANPDMNARFLREAEAASRLDHPNLIHVFDARLAQGGPTYLVMDLVEGPTLSEWLRKEGPWGEEETMELLRKLASGLAHAHAHGIIHRDLKPENIIFGPEPRLTDFGVAWVAPSPEAPQLTRAGEVLGTPGFIAPEVVMGHPASLRADLYALGMVGFQTLIGRHPYSGSEMEVMSKTLKKSVPALGEFGIEAPRLEPLLHRLVAPDPNDRPGGAKEVEGELESLLIDEGPKPARRRGRFVALLSILLLGLGALTLVLGRDNRSGPDPVEVQVEVEQPAASAEPPSLDLPSVDVTPAAEPTAEDGALDAEPPEVDRAPAAPPPRRRPERRRPGARPRPVEEAPKDQRPPPMERLTAAEFQDLYQRVARVLDGLDQDQSAPLRERFMSIPFTRALQDQTARARATRILRKLEAESHAP